MSRAEQVREFLRARGSAGATFSETAAELGITLRTASGTLCCMAERGKVVKRNPEGGYHTPRRYFLPEFAPAESLPTADNNPTPRQVPKKLNGIRLDPQAPAIVPPNVKRTVCPTNVDSRFTVQHPKTWKGEITKDWQQRRLSESARGSRG